MSSSTEAIRAALDRVEELEEMRRTGTNYAIVQLAEEGLAEWTPRFAKALSLALEVLERDAASEVMKEALRSADEALATLWASIGDRLLARGPLAKEYAHNALAEIKAARAALAKAGKR